MSTLELSTSHRIFTVVVSSKLYLNLFDEDVGYQFGVYASTVSRNFHFVVKVSFVRTAHSIKWPDRLPKQKLTLKIHRKLCPPMGAHGRSR